MKQANNPNYGRPSPKKQNSRMRGWLAWARGMALARQVNEEIAEKRKQLYFLDDKFANV